MPILPIDSLDDPRVELYRNLKDRDLARRGDFFLAEGEFIVRRLLASEYACESVLVEPHRAEALAEEAGPDVPIYVVRPELLNGVIGFAFHRGALAIGRRKAAPGLGEIAASPAGGRPMVLVIPQIHNSENLGAIIRSAACLGVTGMLLGERCSDPFWRRTLRVSMGGVFSLPIRMSSDLHADLETLRGELGFTVAATTLDEAATMLPDEDRPARLALMLGSEDRGIAAHWLKHCDRLVTLPMSAGMDSLNVAMAAAVFLYHYAHVAQPAPGR